MDEFLNNLYTNSSAPVLSALILGLMTAISPCPMATNITAIGFISKDIEDKRKVFINGLIYTLGRIVGYTGLAAIIFIGADRFELSGIFQKWGDKIIGPILIIIGVLMLGVIKIKFPGFNKFSNKIENKSKLKWLDMLTLGIIFALAFCPYSGTLYFAMLIPLTLSSSAGLILPIVFAFATSILVIVFSWLIAYMLASVGRLYNKLKNFEFWFRRIVAVLFIAIGCYHSYFLIIKIF